MTKPLTETRKADRAEMARQLEALILDKGATCEVRPSIWGPRATTVAIETAHRLALSVDFDGDSSQPDTHVLSWHFKHGGAVKLQAGFAPSVNPFHFRKATDIAHGFDELLSIISQRLDSVNSGAAFQLGST